MADVLMTVNGHNGQIDLLPDKIRINRKGVLAFATQGLKGSKEILISHIASIQFKNANPFLNGYIQFAFVGGREAKGGIFEATKDENTVMFTAAQQKSFEALKEAIEEQMAAAHERPSALPDLETIEKLAALRDKGIITDDEFSAKKKQILGI